MAYGILNMFSSPQPLLSAIDAVYGKTGSHCPAFPDAVDVFPVSSLENGSFGRRLPVFYPDHGYDGRSYSRTAGAQWF